MHKLIHTRTQTLTTACHSIEIIMINKYIAEYI